MMRIVLKDDEIWKLACVTASSYGKSAETLPKTALKSA